MNQVSDNPISKTDPESEILQHLEKIAETGNKFCDQILELGQKLKSYREGEGHQIQEYFGQSNSPDWMKSIETKLQEMAKAQQEMSVNIQELEKRRFNLQNLMAGKIEDVMKDVAKLKSLTKMTKELKPKLNEGKKITRELESQVEKMTRDLKGNLDLLDSNIKSNKDAFTSSLKKFDLLTPEVDSDGWIVIQRRDSGPREDFERGWTEYENGFGSVDGNFWIGLKKIHELTADGSKELRVELTDWERNIVFAEFSKFSISNAEDVYRLSVDGYSGDAGDSLQYHNGGQFSTHDKKTGKYQEVKGGWWKNTDLVNLNGLYYEKEETKAKTREDYDLSGVYWYDWRRKNYSLQKVEMKIRKRK